MRLRTSLLAAAIALTGFAGGANAAPSCNLIVDAEGDDTVVATPSDASTDIISGDVASDASVFTAVLRVKKLANPNPRAPFGQSYFMVFNVKGSPDPLYVAAGLYPTGNEFIYGYQGVDPGTGLNTSYKLGNALGNVDIDKGELRIHVPLNAFAEKAKLTKGTKVSGMIGEARMLLGQRVVPSQQVGPQRVPLGGFTLTVDTAEATKSYNLGDASCVAVGK